MIPNKEFRAFKVTGHDGKPFKKYESAVGWAAANHHLSPAETSQLSRTGKVRDIKVQGLRRKGR